MLHESKSLDTALRNCYKLLRVGGRLVLSDLTNPLSRTGFVFGTLPNWWPSEDDAVTSPVISESAWDEKLRALDFSGLDIALKDAPDGISHKSSMMITSKPKTIIIPFEKVVLISPNNPSETAVAMSANVGKKLEEMGLVVEHATLESAANHDSHGKPFVHKKPMVSLLEVEAPLVANLSKTEFDALQKVLLSCSGGLWVSRGGRQVDPSGDPAFCAITGLLRTFRGEKPDQRVLELDFSSKMDISSDKAANIVGKVLRSVCNDDLLQLESEFSELDGRLYVPRLFDEPHKNHSLQTIGHQRLPELQPFVQPNRPLKLDIGVPGMLDTLRFIDDPLPLGELGENEVEMEVVANSMNFL